jgi:hypothetical protein
MEEGRKREERLQAERMVEAKKMKGRIFEIIMKSVKKRKVNQLVLQRHPTCTCADCSQERE